MLASTTAFGTSRENTYDDNHNIIDVNSVTRAGSFGDPNVSISMDYDDFTNNDSRWFVFK